ncbi:hypothetical protein ACFVHW_04045 [Streptomyces sp. NPDC127110]|uniref:hypothetical protein n=1 Tax=Streptomyces sp. NPDC127110 TaxID=3345362 RepID=UPI003644075E
MADNERLTADRLRTPVRDRDGVWDMPDGDWVPEGATDAQREANVFYRLGSKALRRDDLDTAARWLVLAMPENHPGAVFRLAAAASRMNSSRTDWAVRILVGLACVLEHGDAVRLRPLLSNRRAPVKAGTWEDPEFAPEILEALRNPRSDSGFGSHWQVVRPAQQAGAYPPTLVGNSALRRAQRRRKAG